MKDLLSELGEHLGHLATAQFFGQLDWGLECLVFDRHIHIFFVPLDQGCKQLRQVVTDNVMQQCFAPFILGIDRFRRTRKQ